MIGHNGTLNSENFDPNGFCCVGLDNPKTAANVGAVLRAAGCFAVKMVAVSGRRYQQSSADARKAYRDLPFLQIRDLREAIPYDCIPVAVDLVANAVSLLEYQHPERAFYVFGAEDATLGNRITSWCRDTIYVPTRAPLNLAATVNIVLYDRLAKANKKLSILPNSGLSLSPTETNIIA